MEELLKIEDVARIFGKSKKTIYNWVEGGVIPQGIIYRLGNGIRFKKIDIDDFIETKRSR